MDAYIELAKFVPPEYFSISFCLANVEYEIDGKDKRLLLYLDERNIAPEDAYVVKVNRFNPESLMGDFPIRDA